MIVRTTKQIIRETEALFNVPLKGQAQEDFIKSVNEKIEFQKWVCLEDLKKEIEKMKVPINKEDEYNTRRDNRLHNDTLNNVLRLCKSSEQVGERAENSIIPVSGEHNTGEEMKASALLKKEANLSSPVQNPKKCTCSNPLRAKSWKNETDIICGRCGGAL